MTSPFLTSKRSRSRFAPNSLALQSTGLRCADADGGAASATPNATIAIVIAVRRILSPTAAVGESMRRTAMTMAMVALGVALAAPPSASAHRSPVDCNANEFGANLLRDRFDVKNGDVINYRVTLDNLSSTATKACDVSNITVRLQFPGPDGQPSSTFQTVVAAANYSAEQPVL